MSPPASRQDAQPTFREVEKQARAFDEGGAVRVFNENNYLVDRLNLLRDSEQVRRILAAPNAVPVRKRGGKLVAIRLQSFGDDRGHADEQHGRSTVTTERVRNDAGQYVGSENNVKHKEMCKTWGSIGERTYRDT